MTNEMFEKISNAMKELDEDTLLECVREVAANGGDADKAMEACQQGIAAVGELYEDGEYYVADLIFSGDLMNEAVEVLKPLMSQSNGGSVGKMIICTVKNDIHDIGKNIVKGMLECNGFDVLDLGVDVEPEAIVAAAKENDIHIIALSGVLTPAIDSMKETVDAFIAVGMRDKVKIVIGGAPVSAEYCVAVGADGWAHEVSKTVELCAAWAKEF